MKWKKENNATSLIEVASDAEGNRFQVMTKRGSRSWQVFKNGILVTDQFFTRNNAKAQVDNTIEVKEDLRRLNTGRPAALNGENRSPRRTLAEIRIEKSAFCSRCGSRDKEGAVIDVIPTVWASRKFSYCMACLEDFANFNAPIKRKTDDDSSIDG